jgi:hypothetical protein
MTDANPLSAIPNGVDISPQVNAMFVGITLSTVYVNDKPHWNYVLITPSLWGVVATQVWTYFTWNKDGWMLRTFVSLIAHDAIF